MSKYAPLLTAMLATGTPALAEEPAMDLSNIETVLPADNPHLAAIMTLVTARVAMLGLPLKLVPGDGPGKVVYKGVPHDQFNAVLDTVNSTPEMNGLGCVGFVITPDTDLSPEQYDGPWDMGAHCWEGAPMPYTRVPELQLGR